MPHMMVKAPVKAATISAVVTRANGTVEDLGIVASYHHNPLTNTMNNLKLKLGLTLHDSDVFK